MGEAIMVEVIRLSGLAGLPIWITLALLLASAVLLIVGKKLGGLTWPKGESGPPPNPDGTGGDGGPGGPGVTLPTDPDHPGGDSFGG